MAQLKEGQTAPEFNLPAQDEKNVALKDFRGKKVLIFFYPKAMTSGCTKQACSVQDAKDELAEMGVLPIGISPDPVRQQDKFASKYGLKYPLLSDFDYTVAPSYGVWGEESMYGKKYDGIIRSAFLVGEDGRMIKAWYKIKPDQTVQKVREALA